MTHLWALPLAKSLVSSRCCLCPATFDWSTASSLEAPIKSATNPLVEMMGRPVFPLYNLSRLFSNFRHRLEILTRPPAAIKTKFDGRFHQRGVVGIQSMREELGHGLHRKEVRVHQL